MKEEKGIKKIMKVLKHKAPMIIRVAIMMAAVMVLVALMMRG